MLWTCGLGDQEAGWSALGVLLAKMCQPGLLGAEAGLILLRVTLTTTDLILALHSTDTVPGYP